jgi:hypothetical protein
MVYARPRWLVAMLALLAVTSGLKVTIGASGEEPAAALRALSDLEARIAADVRDGKPLDYEGYIAALDAIEKAIEGKSVPRAQASRVFALRGAFAAQLRRHEQACRDFEQAMEDESATIEIPTRSYQPEDAQDFGRYRMTRRPVAELLYESLLAESHRVRVKLAQAPAYVDIAALAAKKWATPKSELESLDAVYRRDSARIPILIRAAPALIDQAVVAGGNADTDQIVLDLARSAFTLNHETGEVVMPDSKTASMVLLRLAELCSAYGRQMRAESKPSEESALLDGVAILKNPSRLVVRVVAKTDRRTLAKGVYTPIQLTLLALSIPSVSEESYSHGLKILSSEYKAFGAGGMAGRIEHPAADSPQRRSAELSRATEALKSLLANPNLGAAAEDGTAILSRLAPASGARTGADVIRDNLNPLLTSELRIDGPSFAINALESRRSGGAAPVATDLVERLQASAVESFIRWKLARRATDPGLAAKRADGAIRLAVDTQSLLGAPDSAERSRDRKATAPPLASLLDDVFAELAKDHSLGDQLPSLRAEFMTLAKAVDEIAKSGLLEGPTPTLDAARGLYASIVGAESNSPLKSSPLVIGRLTDVMIRHGLFAEAREGQTFLSELKGNVGPLAMVLRAAYERRNHHDGAANDHEGSGQRDFSLALGHETVEPRELEAAILSLDEPVSPGYRKTLIAAILKVADRGEGFASQVLETLSKLRILGFDEYLVRRLTESAPRAFPAGDEAEAGPSHREPWRSALAATARSGGRLSAEWLVEIYYRGAIAPELSLNPVGGAGAPKHITPRERHEFCREILETLARLNSLDAFSLAAQFYEVYPALLSAARPNGHRVELERLLPRSEPSWDGGIRSDRPYWHVQGGVERMTGAEFLEWLAVQAQSETDAPLGVRLRLEEVMRPGIPDGRSPALAARLKIDTVFLGELQQFLLRGLLAEKGWWKRVDAESPLALSEVFLNADAARKEPLFKKPEHASKLAALLRLRASLHLGSIEVAAASKDLRELAAVLAAIPPAKAGAAVDDPYLTLAKSDVAVPYFREPLTLNEAIAFAGLFNRAGDPAEYRGHVATLSRARAVVGTDFVDGLKALDSLFGDPVTTAKRGAWSMLQTKTRLEVLWTSGLAPLLTASRLADAGVETDLALHARWKNLSGSGVGLRLPVLGLAPAPNTPKWLAPEDVLVVYSDDPVQALEASYLSWANRQTPGLLTMSSTIGRGLDDARFVQRAYEWLTGGPAPAERAKEFVADSKPGKRPRLLAGLLGSGRLEGQESYGAYPAWSPEPLSQIDRTRWLHHFPESITDADVASNPFLLNDRGISALREGDFARAEQCFKEATKSARAETCRVLAGARAISPEHGTSSQEAWSFSSSQGKRYEAASGSVEELPLALTAQRNLAVTRFLQGDFEQSLTTFYKVREVELRQGVRRHADPLFGPIDYETLFPWEVRPLREAATALAEATLALQGNEPLKALSLLEQVPAAFAHTRMALRMQLVIRLRRLSGLLPEERRRGALPDVDLARFRARLDECDRLATELEALSATRTADGRMSFVHSDPGLFFLHAHVLEQLGNPSKADETREQGCQLLAAGLTEIDALFGAAPPPRQGVEEWVASYLEAAPRLLASHPEMFIELPGKTPKHPVVWKLYEKVVKRSCETGASPLLAALALRPLAEEGNPYVDRALADALPLKGEEFAALAALDETGMSRLDWLLAALVRAGRGFDASQARTKLRDRCERLDAAALPDVYFALLDALIAVDPLSGERVALAALARRDPSSAEGLLARDRTVAVRAAGTRLVPLIGDPSADSWYRDSIAFWHYPWDEPRRTVGDALADTLEKMLDRPQDIARLVPEIDSLTWRERLNALGKVAVAGSALDRFHGQLARLLARSNTPDTLALLLRYCDHPNTPPSLEAARRTAVSQDYGVLARLPWSVVEPGKGSWADHLGEIAWGALKRSLPARTEIAAPVPPGSFGTYVGQRIHDAIASGDETHRMVVDTETAFSTLFYVQLRKLALEANGLTAPLDNAKVNTLVEAIDRAKAAIYQALIVKYPPPAAPPPPAPPPPAIAEHHKKIRGDAEIIVNDELEPLTIQLWCVASYLATQEKEAGGGAPAQEVGSKLTGMSMNEISTLYRRLDKVWKRQPDAVVTEVVDGPIEGPLTETVYPGGMKLTGRRVFLPRRNDQGTATYEETFALDEQRLVFRGEIPHRFRKALRQQPAMLDILDLSLAQRDALLLSPPHPIYHTLDLAVAQPAIAWPAIAQMSGREYLNGFLMASAARVGAEFPTTVQELMKFVLGDPAPSFDVVRRVQESKTRNTQLVEAKFNEYYAAQVQAGARGIPDKIRTRWLFFTLREDDNLAKRALVNDASWRGNTSRIVLAQLDQFNWLDKLKDPDDPPRFVYVEETTVSLESNLWHCSYKVVTSRGKVAFLEADGEVGKLPKVVQEVIRLNPQLVTHLRLDLANYTADPTIQLALALKTTAEIEGGKSSVLMVMQRLGLSTADLKAAVQNDTLKLLQSDDKTHLDLKQKLVELDRQARRVLPDNAQPVLTASEYLEKRLPGEIKRLDDLIRNEGQAQANRNVGTVANNSHDTYVWGVPGILEIRTNNGKLVGFQVVVGFQLDVDKPSTITPIFPYDARPPIDRAQENQARLPRWRLEDAQAGLERAPVVPSLPPRIDRRPPAPTSDRTGRGVAAPPPDKTLVTMTDQFKSITLPLELSNISYRRLGDAHFELVCPESNSCGPLDVASYLMGGKVDIFVNGILNEYPAARENAMLLAERRHGPVLLFHNPPNPLLFNTLPDVFLEKLGFSSEPTSAVGSRIMAEILRARPDTHFTIFSHSEGEPKTENLLGAFHSLLVNRDRLATDDAWCKINDRVVHLSFGGAHRPSAFSNKVRFVQVGDLVSRAAVIPDPTIALLRRQFWTPPEIEVQGWGHTFNSYMTRVPSLEQYHLAPPLPKECEKFLKR